MHRIFLDQSFSNFEQSFHVYPSLAELNTWIDHWLASEVRGIRNENFDENGLRHFFLLLRGDEVHHVLHVLRMRVGEKVELVYKSFVFTAELVEQVEVLNAYSGYINKNHHESFFPPLKRSRENLKMDEKDKKRRANDDKILYLRFHSILSNILNEAELPVQVILLQGLMKGEKWEYLLQKAVELGVRGIIPVQMQRSVLRTKDSSFCKENKIHRWNRIMLAAAQQSKRTYIPCVGEEWAWDDLLKALEIYQKQADYYHLKSRHFIAYEDEKKDSFAKAFLSYFSFDDFSSPSQTQCSELLQGPKKVFSLAAKENKVAFDPTLSSKCFETTRCASQLHEMEKTLSCKFDQHFVEPFPGSIERKEGREISAPFNDAQIFKGKEVTQRIFSDLFKEKKPLLFLWVGPEGGFVAKEIKELREIHASSIHLGSRILRTETAALSCLAQIEALIQYEKLQCQVVLQDKKS